MFGRNMTKGETITAADLLIKRPAVGLRSRYANAVVGATLVQSMEKEQPLKWGMQLAWRPQMSKQNPNHATEEWNKEIQREKERKFPKWPNEVMLKILFGGSDYLKSPFALPEWRVLDDGLRFRK